MSEELNEKIPRVKEEDIRDLEKKYGILLKHMKQIREYNKRLNWIIILRPINRDVADKLKSGAKGKIINIKEKSSEFKFLAGDIPFEAALSKLGKNGEKSNWDKIAYFNSININSLKNSDNNKELEGLKEQIEKLKNSTLTEKLKNKILKYNLNFNLGKIQKTVEIEGTKYECFYEYDPVNRHPKYEEYNGTQQPIIYVRKIGEVGNYSKIEYNDSQIGYAVNNSKQIDSNNINLKPIEIFSYERYEECAISNNKKIRIGDITKDGFEIEDYYEDINNSEIFYVKAKKEGENNFKYYPLKCRETLVGQDEIDTYEIDSTTIEIGSMELKKLDKIYELTKPPLTADYDQLSAAEIYENEKQTNNLTDLNSVVKFLKKEQKKLISFPASEYLDKCKSAAERLSKGKYYKGIYKDINLLSEVSEAMMQIDETIKKESKTTKQEEYDKKLQQMLNYNVIVQESNILQLKFNLLGTCGKSITKNTMKLSNILDYSINHGSEILHYPPEPIKLKHTDGMSDQEFLVIDGEGNPRIARNLEDVLFFINDQRKKGICCLEANPLWPIKINFNKSPHEIQIDENSDSPLLTNGFYAGIVELQKNFETESFTDKFIYAERLMLNSDFVPRIKLPDGVKIKDVRKEIETSNLEEAYKYYGEILKNLKILKYKSNKKYDKNFMNFCQNQKLSALETNDIVLDIFKNKNKVKNYLTNVYNIRNIEEFASEISKINITQKSKEDIRKEIKDKILTNINDDIKDNLAEILMDKKIRAMLLSKPDNYDLKAKILSILPNVNLLKGFEIKKDINKKQKNFMEHLDSYIKLIENRRLQIKDRLRVIRTTDKEKYWQRKMSAEKNKNNSIKQVSV